MRLEPICQGLGTDLSLRFELHPACAFTNVFSSFSAGSVMWNCTTSWRSMCVPSANLA